VLYIMKEVSGKSGVGCAQKHCFTFSRRIAQVCLQLVSVDCVCAVPSVL